MLKWSQKNRIIWIDCKAYLTFRDSCYGINQFFPFIYSSAGYKPEMFSGSVIPFAKQNLFFIISYYKIHGNQGLSFYYLQ